MYFVLTSESIAIQIISSNKYICIINHFCYKIKFYLSYMYVRTLLKFHN